MPYRLMGLGHASPHEPLMQTTCQVTQLKRLDMNKTKNKKPQPTTWTSDAINVNPPCYPQPFRHPYFINNVANRT